MLCSKGVHTENIFFLSLTHVICEANREIVLQLVNLLSSSSFEQWLACFQSKVYKWHSKVPQQHETKCPLRIFVMYIKPLGRWPLEKSGVQCHF